MNHKQKLKLARRMQTREEIRSGAPVFMSDAWEQRAAAKKRKVFRQRERAIEQKKIKAFAL